MKKIAIVFFLITLILFLYIYFTGSNNDDEIASKDSAIETLKTLPYLSWVSIDEKDKKKSGVIRYNENLSYAGMNIYNSRPRNISYLMDMNGNILYSWTQKTGGWHHIELGPNGDLYVIVKDRFLMKLDKYSNVIWKNYLSHHHDLAISQTGDIYSLTRKAIEVDFMGRSIPVLDNYISILGPDGKLKKKISFYKLFKDKIPVAKIDKINEFLINKPKDQVKIKANTLFDIFHPNTIEIIKKDISGLCKKGDVLVAARDLNMIAIIDLDAEDIIWDWGEGEVQKPHHPSIIGNGNILIFDNGVKRTFSRVLEIDPIAKKNYMEI